MGQVAIQHHLQPAVKVSPKWSDMSFNNFLRSTPKWVNSLSIIINCDGQSTSNGIEKQPTSIIDQPLNGQEVSSTSSTDNEHPRGFSIKSTSVNVEPQSGSVLVPASTAISSVEVTMEVSEPHGGSEIIPVVPSDSLNKSASPSKPQSTVSARGREWMAEKVRALKSSTSPQHGPPSPENEPKKAVIRTSRRRRRRQKHHDRKPFSEYLPVVTPLSKQPIDPSQGQVLEESLVLEQPISPHRGIFQDVVCEDAVPIAHSESIPSSTAIVPLNNQNVITDQSLTNSALLWVERRSFDPSRRQLEKRHSLFQNDVEESFDPRFLRKALRSVVSLPFEYFRPNSMEPVIPEPPPLAPIVEEPPDGPPFQDGPPLLATLQALMKERDRQTAWIFPPDDPSGDDCSDTEYVPEDDDPLNCLVKEPAYLTDQPNSGLHKRVSIESVEKTVEETNTITLTQSGVELTISQNRKKTVKKSMERPAPTTLIDPAHVDDIEKLRHAIDPSTGMINLANVENPVWDFITVPPPDNPQEVTFEEFYGFPSRSQPVNETPVVSPNEPKLGEASPRPKQPRFTISLDDSSEECPAEESSAGI
ncbi:hypothetical protein BLNAU_23500 [Blattamonas nauphoetae]|uniref:Uncharacterized protein n=1 Tax=Blattamonas nauphoetae TaxID=2049346 RepID=A0ABQ9WQ24_9EUKA|nr:hypothetical protein BLNAU_23500 [Blattamonas nauphoetae]